MFNLKPISKSGIPTALEKAERYRLLNDPAEAESICRDVLEIDPENQKAVIALILSITDQFGHGSFEKHARELLPRLSSEYDRAYYEGIILERQAKAVLKRGTPGSQHDAYEWFHEAMEQFEKAEKLRPEGNDAAILRWNACIRTILRHQLVPRSEERVVQFLE